MPFLLYPAMLSRCWGQTKLAEARGQSLVELALVLPLLLMILVGVLDLGRAYYAYMGVINAAREGARFAATAPPRNTSTQQAIVTRADAEATNITLASVVASCPSNAACLQGDPVQVTVTTNFQLITAYILGGGTIPLRASAQFVILAP